MIARLWHGWRTNDIAAAYEALLTEEIFTGIQDCHIPPLRASSCRRGDAGVSNS